MHFVLMVALIASTFIIPCVGNSFTATSLEYDPVQV